MDVDSNFLQRQQEILAKNTGSCIDNIEDFAGDDEERFFERLRRNVEQYDRNQAALNEIKKGGISMTKKIDELPDILKPEEVAEFLEVPVRTVKYWLAEKSMVGTKAGREWRVMKTDLLDYLEKGKNRQ